MFQLKHMATALLLLTLCTTSAIAEDYRFDIKGQHAFIQFKVKHLGYSWLLGEFRSFDGTFSYDEKQPEKNKVSVHIKAASLDSNHAERDKHLRSPDFFDVQQYPDIHFVSTSYEATGKQQGIIHGTLSLRGIQKDIAIQVQQIGTGKDPWGGYRRGFEGHTTLHLSDYHMPFAAKLGEASENIELFLSIEGIRQ